MALKLQWVKQTRLMRDKYAELQKSLSIKAIMAEQAAKKVVFNPLAPVSKDPVAMAE